MSNNHQQYSQSLPFHFHFLPTFIETFICRPTKSVDVISISYFGCPLSEAVLIVIIKRHISVCVLVWLFSLTLNCVVMATAMHNYRILSKRQPNALPQRKTSSSPFLLLCVWSVLPFCVLSSIALYCPLHIVLIFEFLIRTVMHPFPFAPSPLCLRGSDYLFNCFSNKSHTKLANIDSVRKATLWVYLTISQGANWPQLFTLSFKYCFLHFRLRICKCQMHVQMK